MAAFSACIMGIILSSIYLTDVFERRHVVCYDDVTTASQATATALMYILELI